MADILATLFKFRQFIFEFGPFFLAAWLSLAMTTGLITAAQRKGLDLKASPNPFLRQRPLHWIGWLFFFGLWRPGGKVPGMSTSNGRLLFSLIAPVPALVVTSLIGMEAVWLRLILTTLFVLLLRWFLASILPNKRGNSREQQAEVEMVSPSRVSDGDDSALPAQRQHALARVTWKSFAGQVDGAIIPLIIGFSLASVLTIYVPAYTVRPWLGEGAWQGPYLAALLALPLQLTGGAEVLLASALLVKGASLGTALSIMLVAPSAAFSVLRHLGRARNVRATALYLGIVWFLGGSLGVVVDGIQRLFSGGS